MKARTALTVSLTGLSAILVMLSPSAVLCSSDTSCSEIVFEIEIDKDTVLVYEEVDLRFVIRNNGPTPFVRRPFTVGPDLKYGTLIDVTSGRETTLGNIALNRFGSPEPKVILQPREEIIGAGAILLRLVERSDSTGRSIGYLPPSTYEVVCSWEYDPNSRRLDSMVEPMILADTVRFTVIPAMGLNHDALDLFLEAYDLCRNHGPQRCAEVYWRLAKRFPETPYATEATGVILSYVYLNMSAALPRVDTDSLLCAYVLARPNNWHCTSFVTFAIRKYIERLEWRDLRGFITKLNDSVPHSYASSVANREISEYVNRKHSQRQQAAR
jgi:hypothetical protein